MTPHLTDSGIVILDGYRTSLHVLGGLDASSIWIELRDARCTRHATRRAHYDRIETAEKQHSPASSEIAWQPHSQRYWQWPLDDGGDI